jgi:hypothetical protein
MARWLGRAVHTAVHASPAPGIGTTHQSGTERIALDVAEHRRQVLALLDGKRFKSPLIDVPHADRLVVRMVSEASASPSAKKKFRDFVVLPAARPDHKMPVVSHDRVARCRCSGMAERTGMRWLSSRRFTSIFLSSIFLSSVRYAEMDRKIDDRNIRAALAVTSDKGAKLKTPEQLRTPADADCICFRKRTY